MFDRASLKLGLDRAVLQSMNTTQGGRIDPNAQASKQLTKKEVEDLLKRGAYGALMDEDDGEKFCEEDIDVILERRTQIITLESGEKGSTFSKASFAATGNREDISVDDPDFWKKWAKRAEIDPEELNDKNALVLDEPRRRTQIRRYGHDEGVMVDTDVDSSTDSEEDGNVGDRTRSGKINSKRSRSGKGKRGRRGNLDEEYIIDDGIVEYGKWSKSECYKIERGLLTFG
jgi:chromodomain-helicase-DNA-binding protein 7